MTTRHALGRHRATPVRSNPLESISKAVSSNAGSVGRQAAVIAAASGLVLSIGVPAQATPATREADKAPVALNVDRTALKTAVQAPATVKVAAAKTKADASVDVASIKSATDGSDYRAAKKAQAERQEAAAQAAAEQRQQAAADAREAAAERRQAAAERQATADRQAAPAPRSTTPSSSNSSSNTSSASSNSAGSNTSSSSSNSTSSPSSSHQSTAKKTVTTASSSVKKTAVSTGNSSIAAMAKQYLGSPYVFGGSTPGGWDCSGFVQYVYGKAGVSLPHNARAQRASGKLVRTSNPKPGDLVFQSNDSHVGIYIGGGKMIGAQNPSVGTVVRDTTGAYAAPLVGYYTLAG